MSYYDTEAPVYDETRGGVPRAEAAAAAIRSLLPDDVDLVLDLAGGTGIVGSRLGVPVLSMDRSIGMSRLAVRRMPGRVVQCEGTALPVASSSVGVVTTIWLLHMLEPAVLGGVVGEIGRALRPGGVWLTTVNKRSPDPSNSDDVNKITALAAAHGMTRAAAETTFVGIGQGTDGNADPVYRLVTFTRARSVSPTAADTPESA